MKSGFDTIAAGVEDAIAYANGEPGRGKTARPIRWGEPDPVVADREPIRTWADVGFGRTVDVVATIICAS